MLCHLSCGGWSGPSGKGHGVRQTQSDAIASESPKFERGVVDEMQDASICGAVLVSVADGCVLTNGGLVAQAVNTTSACAHTPKTPAAAHTNNRGFPILSWEVISEG